MESKKINQLATELAPVLSDLTIIGDPTTGISKKITLSQMASLFTGTVEEYPNLASFPLVGTADTIYIALDTNIIYRWNTGTSAYVELSPNIVTSLVFSDANGFDGTISLVGSTATLTITTALTTGSVPFIGASGALSQDNANLFFDDTNNRLGINTNSPTTALDVFGSGIIGRINGTSTNNAFLGFASAGSNKWSIGNVQSNHRFRIYNEATTSELVSVLQTGEFGIGIANPTTKLHIDGGASALIANLDANVSVAKSISFRSDNSARINLEVSGTESGSNAGADFFIRRYSDAGALIDTPFAITRSTGIATFASSVNATQYFASIAGGTSTYSELARFQNTSINSGSKITFYGKQGSDASAKLSGAIGFNQTNNSDSNGQPAFIIETGNNGTITEKLRVTHNGYLGINTTSPSTQLHIVSGKPQLTIDGGAGAGAGFLLNTSLSGTDRRNWFIGTEENIAGDFVIKSSNAAGGNALSGTTRLTILSTGDVGIGVIPATFNTIGPVLQMGRAIFYGYNNEAALGANFRYEFGDKYINTDYGCLYQMKTGTHVFSTAPSGTAGAAMTLTPRMTIINNGNVLVGISTTSAYLDGQLSVSVPSGTIPASCFKNLESGQFVSSFWNSASSGDNIFLRFVTEAGASVRGTIDYNRAAGVTRYGTTSDANLKNIIGDSDKQKSIEILSSTKIKEYSWKDDKINKVQVGVIAQELYETFKGAVSKGSEDELFGTEEYKNWEVDKTAFTFHLIAGWQKHEEIIANLEARIKQLESK
jgi:hypothetical protein